MKRILLALFLLPLFSVAQNSLNTTLLYNWQDSTLVSSYMWDNVYNEIWGVVVNDREFAIIGSTDGTHIFDVTDPVNSIMVAYVAGEYQGDGVIHRDYHDYQGYLYIVCDEGWDVSTLQIVDISDLPNSVSVVYDSNDLLNTVHNIFIDTTSARLYTTSGKVLSIEDPENPTLLYSTGDLYLHDLYVRNDTVYANTGGSLKVYDFSMMSETNQTHEEIGALLSYPNQGYNHSGWLSADGDYYVMADETHGMKMKMVDVSDLTNMTGVSLFNSEVDPMSVPHNQIIHGDYVYTAHYHDGLYVHDISDASNPSLVAFYDTFSPEHHDSYMGAWGVYPFLPSGNILVSDMQTGLYVLGVDYSSPPVSVAGLGENTVSVYPNPTTKQLNIRLAEGEKAMASIYNMQGQKVMETKVLGRKTISLAFLPAGVYNLSLDVNEVKMNRKIIKQ